MKIIATCFVVLLSLPVFADQDQGIYLGLAGHYIDSGVASDTGGSISFSSIDLIGGYKKSNVIGGELRIGSGLNDDSSYGFDLSIPLYYSLYYRAELANDVAKSFILLGFSNLEVEAKNQNTNRTNSESDTGLSWGAGIGFVVNENVNLNFEFIKLLSNSDNDFDSAGISLDYRF